MTEKPPAIVTSLLPELATTWTGVLTDEQLGALLVQAIYTRRVAEISRCLLSLGDGTVSPGGFDLLERARDACEAVVFYNREQQRQLVDLLLRAGVSARTGDVEGQYHSFVVELPASDLSRALVIVEDEGYGPCHLWRGGALASLLRSRSQLDLIKADEVTTRLCLRWGSGPVAHGFRQRLQPSVQDYGMLRVPSWLWPVYHLIKPVRAGFARLLRRQSAAAWGPFLGTPIDLIVPLLDVAGVTAQDTVVDLGCGDGRVVLAAAQRGCVARGVESDQSLVDRARSRIALERPAGQATIEHGDLLMADLADASVVFLFLPIHGVSPLLELLRHRLKPGARIIAHEQQFPGQAFHADLRKPLLTACSMTVAYVWHVDKVRVTGSG